MENIHKFESMVAGWYKNVPHLPTKGREWLANNAWWLVMIWVVLGALGVFALLLSTFVLGAAFAWVGPLGATLGGLALVFVTIAALFSIAIVVIGAMAISPLKLMQKKGWTLLFIIALVNVISSVMSFLFSLNMLNLIWNLLSIAVGLYFLFEVREYFSNAKSARKTVTAKHKKA